jgi:phosphatidate cytidylyltransferase
VPGPDPVSGSRDTGRAAAAPRNLALRVLSAIVLAPVALVCAYVGDWPFALFWTAAGLAVLWEWITLVAGAGHRLMYSCCAATIVVAAGVLWLGRPATAMLLLGLGALAAAVFIRRGRRLWIIGGIGYSGVMMLAPMLLRRDDAYGFAAMVFLFAIVWTTDVLAYFFGRAIGGPKLLPAVSPKKTWSGAVAGSLGAVAVAVIGGRYSGASHFGAIGGIALALSVVSQFGDLLESWIKRQFGAKDASQLIPGHGGVMDRLDGFWAAALLGCLIGLARGGIDNAARGLLVW